MGEGIKEAVLQKKMPPWFADAGYAPFANDRTLSSLWYGETFAIDARG